MAMDLRSQSSIEFDKDGDLFAVGGVTKKVKLKYVIFGNCLCGILTTTRANSLIFMSCTILYTNDFVILVQI